MNRASITSSVYFPSSSELSFVGAVHTCDDATGRQCFVEIKFLHAWLVLRGVVQGTKLHDWAKRFIHSSSLPTMGYMSSRGDGLLNTHVAEIFFFVATLVKRLRAVAMEKNRHYVHCILCLLSVALPREANRNDVSPKACGKLNRRASLLGSL